MKEIKNFIKKYKDIILYLFFGVCTTFVNIIIYTGLAHGLRLGTIVSTVLAWIFAVLFAYLSNRKWVFKSRAEHKYEVLKEIVTFFCCRICTGMMDLVIMYVFVDLMKYNDILIKVVVNILVIIINYVASKFVVFKR